MRQGFYQSDVGIPPQAVKQADAKEKVIMLPNTEQKCLENEEENVSGTSSYDISIFNQLYEKSSQIMRQDWCEIVRRYLYQYT